MKNIVANILPDYLARRIINFGKICKKNLRMISRLLKFGTKPFFVTVKTTREDFYIQLDPVKNGCVDEIIAETGKWEKEISDHIESFLSPGDVFLDIGANIGYHSLCAASQHNQTTVIHSFEPIASLYTQFQNSVEKNNFRNITIHKHALGETNGEMEINLRDENMGGSSLHDYKNLDIVATSGKEMIKIKTLDSIFSPTTQINVIKIDVEGYEFEALAGGKKLIEKQKPIIIMEFSPLFYKKDYPNKAKDFIAFLETFDYTFETIENRPIDLHKWLDSNQSDSQIELICKVKQ